jgi:2-polyprenyl-3-methyl-5-hydroxy-6-metoxy-1,4-benzoquinol methylase
MDDPTCDVKMLNATYRHFHVVNQFVAGWHRIYERYLRPHLTSGSSLLDIGCGGGDVIQKVATWARQDGLELDITGIDPDVRALTYARGRAFPPNVKFYRASSSDLLQSGERFDVVISNHVLHHLRNDEVYTLCKDSEQLASKLVLHNDIRRSDVAYLGFTISKLFFWNSFVTEDGLRSIRRSFTPRELLEIIPEHWQVKALFPYRNLLVWEKRPS